MRLLLLLLLLLGACAPSVEFRGLSRPARPVAAVAIYEQAPITPHHVIGWVQTNSDPMTSYDLDEHARLVRAQAAARGCDALVWNPNHRLFGGIISNDQTGVWLELRAGLYGQGVVGIRAACIAWDGVATR